MGAALLTRTTRGVTLPEAGADYLARIEPLLTALEEADHAGAQGQGGFARHVARRAVDRLRHTGSDSAATGFHAASSSVAHQSLDERPAGSPRRECRRRASVGRTAGFERHRPSPGSLASLARRLAGLPGTGRVTRHAGQPCGSHEVLVSPLGAGLGWWTFERDGRRCRCVSRAD